MADKQIQAGAAAVVITPNLGVSLSGAMSPRVAENIHDELYARSLVLDNGDTRLALVVLDLIAASKDWLAEIKHQVNGFTGIPMSNILISCTHTHSAVTPVATFQSNVEKEYLKWAGPRVADSVRLAVHRLQPARVGWAVAREDRAVFNRRFFMKPGTSLESPFPGVEDRVKMNPAVGSPAIVRPAGPVDPEITLLAVQQADDPGNAPLAMYASYGMHYVGRFPDTDVSADYFNVVGEVVHDLTGAPRRHHRQPFVAMLANACFGDINNIDVRQRLAQPYPYHQVNQVAELVARAMHRAWKTIKYQDWVALGSREISLDLAVRKPSAVELQQAGEILQRAPQGPLRDLRDIYARETVQLGAWPGRFKTPVQAFRIGDLGLCALPGEPFCQTGLDIKAQSPFRPTLMVGMANDYAGYLPTAEQHALGGYETWRARSSFLETAAAEKIQKAGLELLAELAK